MIRFQERKSKGNSKTKCKNNQSINFRLLLLPYILLFILFIQTISCNGPTKKVMAKNRNGTPGVIYEYPDRSDTLNYLIKVYYPDGKIQKEAAIKNGKYVGEKITYFHNGKIYQIDSLSQPCEKELNDCDGTLIRFNENGTISQRFTVKEGNFNGLSQHYNGHGNLVKEYYLIQDSIKDGQYREYYDNGRISCLASYKNDTLEGYEYFFAENGDTVKYYNHYKGNLDFPYKKWLENGKILFGNYLDKDEKFVVWKWYRKTGE
jgi:antitoxin component YwqK of YwqJK toxin-antitoxin module